MHGGYALHHLVPQAKAQPGVGTGATGRRGRPVVGDLQRRRLRPHGHVDACAAARVLQRVLDPVVQGDLQQHRMPVDHAGLRCAG